MPQSSKQLSIVNGAARFLPKPVYPEAARRYCADGKVKVKVLIGKNGLVKEAKAISGDELLHKSAVAAAQKSRFRSLADAKPIQYHGIIVYNFDALSKCIKTGVVNKKSLFIPTPIIGNVHPKHIRIDKDQVFIDVNIVIDETGNVLSARTSSGHPLIRNAFERSASGAKFVPSNVGPVRIKGILRYTLKSTGEILY